MGYNVVLDTIDFHCVDKNRNFLQNTVSVFHKKKKVKQICNDMEWHLERLLFYLFFLEKKVS